MFRLPHQQFPPRSITLPIICSAYLHHEVNSEFLIAPPTTTKNLPPAPKLAPKGKLIRLTPIRNLVYPKPISRRRQQPRHMSLHIPYIIQFPRQRIIDIDHNHLPVRLPTVNQP